MVKFIARRVRRNSRSYRFRRNWNALNFLAKLTVAAIVVFVFVAIVAATAGMNAFFIALLWNWLGIHSIFSAAALSFWQAMGIGAILVLFGI